MWTENVWNDFIAIHIRGGSPSRNKLIVYNIQMHSFDKILQFDGIILFLYEWEAHVIDAMPVLVIVKWQTVSDIHFFFVQITVSNTNH